MSALLLSACATPPVRLDHDAWQAFIKEYVGTDGRVVDREANGITHSEAQGNTLLLATAFEAPEIFAAVWTWTRTHLQVRADRLFSWRWDPAATPSVTDHNNATDADILIAWSLARAARKWALPEYAAESSAIIDGLRDRMVQRTPQGLVLLPGTNGFERDNTLVVNLSYWVYPALLEFAAQRPHELWRDLVNDGLALLERARFGRWGLPADWIEVGTDVRLANGFPPRFSYDAIRIPLYLTWAGLADNPRLARYIRFWDYFAGASFIPAWTNLRDDSVDSHNAPAGFHAIFALTRKTSHNPAAPASVHGAVTELPREGYYSAVLHLLANVAEYESRHIERL